ncbi:MAG TPA: EVE domain-containing protein, partial [Nocardioides sp.]
AGVVRWWADEAGLTTQAQRRSLQTLRRQIYDLLDGRGVIVKPVSPSAVVDVSPAAEPEPPEAEPPEAEPTEAEPTTPEPSATAVTEGVGAWILRLDPTVWDLARFLADGHREVRAWAVEDDERAAAMARGQRVFLWAGGDGTVLVPGIWGVGWVVGPCESKSVADGYWVDPAGNSRRTLFADVSIQLLPLPVGLQQVVDDPRLAGLEVLRDPDGGNPSRLTPEEAAAMVALVGSGPAPPA